jgi:DNA (cytosine-5)-methyltransferase 1
VTNGANVLKRNGRSPRRRSNGLNGNHVNQIANPPANNFKGACVDIELFAGAGGLALGLAAAGLPPDHLFEQSAYCCNTLQKNSTGSQPRITGQIHEENVALVDWSRFPPVRVLSGGPPCQPFSLGGKHLAERDDRNEFPSAIRAIRELKPAVVLLENVPGFARPPFRPYLEYVIRQLRNPSLNPRHGELWQDHDRRLQRHERMTGYEPEYNVRWWVLNAADFGVAQARVRVVFAASRADLPSIEAPAPTHSRAALVKYQETGDYWRDRALKAKRRREWPRRLHGVSASLSADLMPWTTVRDALLGLPEPSDDESRIDNHWLIPGARIYERHSGSEMDWPAKTVKAGVHGVAGGENVLIQDDRKHRYFTLREMARLQCFPDDYLFAGPRSRIIGQIGNAVPVELARVLGEVLKPALHEFELRRTGQFFDGAGRALSQRQGNTI